MGTAFCQCPHVINGCWDLYACSDGFCRGRKRHGDRGSSQAYGVQEQTGSVESQAEAVESGQYVLMNIPYADFYRAEVGSNTEDVDAFTSATLNKTRTGSLVGDLIM